MCVPLDRDSHAVLTEKMPMKELNELAAFEQRDTALHKTGELYGLLIADLAARIAQCSEDSVLVDQQEQYQTQQRHLHQLNTQQLEQCSQQLAEQVKARYTA